MTILLQRHKQTKLAILAKLRALATISEDVGMNTLSQDILQTRIPKLENERFHLVVLGEFNHGKSTFVNALLGEEILPTGITPTTAAINHVIYGEVSRARAVLKDGGTVDLAPGALAEWVTVAGERWQDVRYVEVSHPTEILKGNITLVDTPGVNDLNEQRAEITYGYVPRADAVIFLLDSGQALKDSEREFLSSHVLEGTRDRLIFVLGKMDLLSESERTAVTDYVRKNLATLVGDPVLFPLSARAWIEGKHAESGMQELLDYLGRFLDTDRAQILLDNAAVDAGRTASYLRQNLAIKLHAFDLDLDELEDRIAHVRAQLDASKRTLDELHVRIHAEAEAIKAQVRLDLEQFTRAFNSALPREIDSVDANDVKQYLPGFLEDTFKAWAELEGQKLAQLLEHLAEEVIAVTNENVAQASKALADRLGPADTAVDIDVDSFKYDIGVYAIGALGTTVFLFVNTLAGGLLTLAAPVLAIVLRSKVAGDIREQAKERAPVAVNRAAEAMLPHFHDNIDAFARRLGDFVTSAGNTLYLGISEVLDRTLTERRQRRGEVDLMRAETAAQVSKVAEAVAALSELRGSIWSDATSGAGATIIDIAAATPAQPEIVEAIAEPPDAHPEAVEATDAILEEPEPEPEPEPDDEGEAADSDDTATDSPDSSSDPSPDSSGDLN